jgi:hypothetical protein
VGWRSDCAATPLIVALAPGHSDITRFRPLSPIAAGNYLDRAERKKIQIWTGTVDVLGPRSGISRPTSQLPHVQIFMNDGPSPLT